MKFLTLPKQPIFVFLFLFLTMPVNALVEYDQNVTPEVIFGSGNSNGSFTTDRRNGVEVGLRAKIPFVGTTNSNGDGTYSFTLDETDHDNNGATDNRWNFEFSVNTNYDGSSGNNIDQYTYELGIDGDPGDGTNFLVFDPITPTITQPFYDHSIGDNSTANSAGAEATDGASYLNLIANNNVLQQSWRHAFFPVAPLDTYNPDSPGTYDVYLIVKLAGIEVARTDIKVIINDHLVTPDVIFGSGNANGSFTLARNNGVELGLRAKIPFSGLINYDGGYTYSYTIAETYQGDANNPNRWNFDFSFNVDYEDPSSSGVNLDEYQYEMGLDQDPSSAKNYLVFDPVTPQNAFIAPDHSMGDNSTTNGGGTEYGGLFQVSTYNTALTNNNVLQNSNFYTTTLIPTYDSSIAGNYAIYIMVKNSLGEVVARTEIQVLIEGAAPANESPLVAVDSYTINEDSSLNASDADATDMDVNNNGVLANDSDAEGDTLTVSPTGMIPANGGVGGSIVMANDGTFTYAPPSDYNGTAVFNYTVSDGVNTVQASLTITVNPVNDAPSFTKGADQTVLEDAGAQTVNNWATSMSAGPADESAQTLSFNVSNDNNGLFSVQPVIDSSGELSYTTTADANGSATITVNIMDDGLTGNGGIDTSVDQTFTIVVAAINDMPAFDIIGDQIFIGLQNSSVQVTGFANNMVLEPNGGEGQAVDSFTVTELSDPQNIITSASIDNNGDLSLEFDINNYGTAVFSVVLKDDGGDLNGGNNLSTTLQFNVSHLMDGLFSDGFEEVIVIKMSEYALSSYENNDPRGLSDDNLPVYDAQNNIIKFMNHQLQLDNTVDKQAMLQVIKHWIDAVLALEDSGN